MKDSERLDLLKEIGGTRVYEERRRESLKIMQETGKSLLDSLWIIMHPSFCWQIFCIFATFNFSVKQEIKGSK